MSPPGHAREARYVTSPKPVKSPLFESARKKPAQHPLTPPNRVLYAVNHLHATTHTYYPAACNNSHPLSGCMRQLQPDNHVYTMLDHPMKTTLLVILSLFTSAYSAEFGIFSLIETNEKTKDTVYSDNYRFFDRGEDSGIKFGDIDKVEIVTRHGQKGISITFGENGAIKNKQFTEKFKGKQIGILVNGKVISAPIIITSSEKVTEITGSFSDDEAKGIAASLREAIQSIVP